jgi:coenzyme F420-0:L-glutamate ligase/coenzyme F420-1:gamma-L-glutamate ligase
MLTLTPIPGIPLIEPGDDLPEIIVKAVTQADISVQQGDIFILAQKIVSKAEGRMVNLADVHPSPKAFDLARQTGKDPV